MKTSENKKNNLLILILGMMGAYAVISQAVILRELLVVLSGNEFFFGIILFSWLVGIVPGAMSGGKISEKDKFIGSFFIASILIILLYFPFLIYMIRNFYVLTGSQAGSFISFSRIIIYLPILIMPFTFFLGFQFPLSAKLISSGEDPDVRNTGKISLVYIFESAGALTGGVVYTFFLAGKVSPFYIYPVLSLIILPNLYFFRITGVKRKIKNSALLILTIIFVFLFLKAEYIENKTIKLRWSGISPIPLEYSTDTKYQNISVSKIFDQFNLYLNGRLSVVFPDDQKNMLLSSHLYVQNPDPERILILGEGVSGLCKDLTKFDFKDIVSVEIDPGIIETINMYLPEETASYKSKENISIIIDDGRRYIKKLIRDNIFKSRDKKKFDIVFVNQGEPGSLLMNRYYTKEFFRDIHKILSRNGTIALRITSSDNYDDGIFRFYTSLQYQTLNSVFKKVVLSSGSEAMLFGAKRDNIISSDPDILKKRYVRSRVEPQKLAMLFEGIYLSEKIKKRDQLFKKSKDIPVNSDIWPVTQLQFSRIEGAYRGIDINFFYSFFLKNKFLILVLLSALIVLIFTGSFIKKRVYKAESALAAGYVLFIMGMSGISLELILIYIFQISFGFIYNSIGLIIAFFMA
ncbi:MAG: hypothetical protein ABFR75_10785, partial [Acidobacteriota bacterium]